MRNWCFRHDSAGVAASGRHLGSRDPPRGRGLDWCRHRQGPAGIAADHNTAGLNAGALVLNLFALAVVAVILIRQRAYALCVAFSAVGLFYIDMLAPMLASSWTAHAAVLPAAAATWRVAAATTASALLLLSAARLGMTGLSAVGVRSRHPAADERFVRASVRALQPVLAPGGNRILIASEPSTWMVGAGLLLQLHKQSIPVAVERHVVGMYGESFRPRGDENVRLQVGDVQEHSPRLREPGTRIIFERDGWFLEQQTATSLQQDP